MINVSAQHRLVLENRTQTHTKYLIAKASVAAVSVFTRQAHMRAWAQTYYIIYIHMNVVCAVGMLFCILFFFSSSIIALNIFSLSLHSLAGLCVVCLLLHFAQLLPVFFSLVFQALHSYNNIMRSRILCVASAAVCASSPWNVPLMLADFPIAFVRRVPYSMQHTNVGTPSPWDRGA